MTTKSSTKRPNSKANSIDPTQFSLPKNSRHTPTSLTGWAEEEKSSLLLPYPHNESRLILKREKQPPKRRSIKTSNSSSNLIQVYTTTKASTRPDQSPEHLQNTNGGWLTKRAKQYMEVLNKIEPKVPTNTGNSQQPIILTQAKNRTSSSYLLQIAKKQEELPIEIKLKENIKEKNKEKSTSFIRLKSQMLEFNHQSPQISILNDQSPASTGRESSKSPSRIPTPYGDSEGCRAKEDIVITSPYPFTPKIKKRVPTGCFNTLSGSKLTFTRKTYMGISRLTNENGSISHRESILGNGNSKMFHNDSLITPEAPNEDKSNSSMTRTRYIHKLFLAQKEPVFDEKGGQVINSFSRRSSFFNDKGYQTERTKRSTIPIPYYVDNVLSCRESPKNQQQNILEKMKIQPKTKKYRPKAFLKTFKPKVKDKASPSELCIRAVHHDYPNTSLIY